MFKLRTVLIVFLVLMTALALSACGQAAEPAEETAPVEEVAPVEGQDAQEEPAEAEEPAEEEAVEEEPFKVAFAHVGPVSDEGWTWSHDEARKTVEEISGVETTMVENMPFSDEATRTLQQFVNDGASMIFITSEYADFVYDVADANPEVMFLETNGHRSSENLVPYYINHWDSSYLIGMAAGLMTESNKLGYVGSFPIDTIYTSVNAFHMGARAVNPDVTTQVVLINSWFDPAAANQAANTLIDDGADFLFGIMDEAAYLEVAQDRGVWAAMWNTDIRRFGPDAYVSSMMLFWDDFYVAEVEAAMNGAWEGGRDVILLPIGEGTDRDEWGDNVPQEVRDQVDAVRDSMINDGLNVFVGPINDAAGELKVPEGDELTELYLYKEWTWAVEGVSGLE